MSKKRNDRSKTDFRKPKKKLFKDMLDAYIIIASVLSILMIIICLFLPWGSIEATGSIGGVDAEAKADFYTHRLEFEGEANTAGFADSKGLGFAQGFIQTNPLTGDPIDLGSNVPGNVTLKGELNYLNPNQEKIQGNAGILYNSYNLKQYDYILIPWADDLVYVTITTTTDMVPWWIAGNVQVCDLSIELNNKTISPFQEITVEEAWFEIWTDWSDEDQKFKTRSYEIPIESAEGKMILPENKGGPTSISFSENILLDSSEFDEYELLGLVGRVKLNMKDSNGDEQAYFAEPATKDSPPSTINVMMMPQSDAASIVGFFFTGVVVVIGLLLGITGIIIRPFKRKPAMVLLIIGGVIVFLMSSFLFYNGIKTLSDLIIFKSEVSYRIGFVLSEISGFILLTTGVADVYHYRKNNTKVSAAFKIITDEPDNKPKKTKGSKKKVKR